LGSDDRALEKERQREKIEVYDWVQQRRAIDCFEIISAPTPLRNKCEFTFGYRYLFKETDKDGNDIDVEADPESIPAVGFMATGWAGGVSRPDCCANIPAEACAMADIFDAFLANSPLLPYDSKVHTGFWRTLTIRTSRRTEECMLVILHAPPVEKDGIDNSEHFAKEKARLLSILTAAELPVPDQAPIKVTSIFFQEFDGQSSPSPDHPIQHAYGKEVLHERLGKCTFQISPGAFFQVNTAGAELLYQLVVDKVREVSTDPENTLLFDVCCGTGTIGLTCMKEGAVGSVVGVDISIPAIEDAKVNAELNGFGSSEDSKKTTRFIAGRAEQVLSAEIGKAKTSGLKFVAVVDPAREGLHADVVKTLRMNERITRIVYVSCNPTATLVRDAALLCGPPTKRYPGRAFLVESAKPVDMFPLTNHCEMVMTFDRLPYKSKANTDEVKPKENGAEVKSNEAEVKSKENGDEVVKSNENEAEVKPNENEAEVKPTEEEGKTYGDENNGEKEIK
jgi:tRNA (uracil-5-)-methyltransferase